jgi:hypothetical protein
MLIVLRVTFGLAFAWAMSQMIQNAESNPHSGDLTNAFWLVVCVGLAMANALVWAPYVGARIAEPLSGMFVRPGIPVRDHFLLRWMHRLDARGHQRLARWVAFLEGVRRPWLPAAFAVGLRNAAPGSWLERVYAREVFKFDNLQHCVRAYDVLTRDGAPGPRHGKPEIELALQALRRGPASEKPPMAVPAAPGPLAPRRNPRIRLFAGEPEADARGASAPGPAAAAGAAATEPGSGAAQEDGLAARLGGAVGPDPAGSVQEAVTEGARGPGLSPSGGGRGGGDEPPAPRSG